MEKIPIGTITKPHGLKGAVRVKTDSDFKDERYKKGNTLYIFYKGNYEKVTVDGYFTKGTLDVLSFKEFKDAKAVEKYRNSTLYIDESLREPLEEDAYYYADLVDLDVYVKDEKIGTVIEVKDMPQSALLRVQKLDGSIKPIPFLKVYIKEVNMEAQAIYIHELEGLI